jgi:hypothetical protein
MTTGRINQVASVVDPAPVACAAPLRHCHGDSACAWDRAGAGAGVVRDSRFIFRNGTDGTISCFV